MNSYDSAHDTSDCESLRVPPPITLITEAPHLATTVARKRPPLSAFVVLRLVVTAAGIDADVDVVPPNPYDDPWNNQPWCGHRKKTRFQLIGELPVLEI